MKASSARPAARADFDADTDFDADRVDVSRPTIDWSAGLDGDDGRDDHDDHLSASPPCSPVDARLSATKAATSGWPESVDGSGLAELCHYVQQLEADKGDLERQVHVLREHEATRERELLVGSRRIALLEASLADAMRASDAFRQEKDIVVGLQASERERTAALAALLEDTQSRCEEAERARQLAVFKLSALQTSVAGGRAERLAAPVPAAASALPAASSRFDNDAISAHIEQYKRELELLRQKLALADERAAERQRLAVAAAVRDAELERSAAVERVRLECETRLSEWRHDEALRAKEAQAALEEDRYSVRLELKHAVQRAEIDQHVARLQSEHGCLCGLAPSPAGSSLSAPGGEHQRRSAGSRTLASQLESDFSVGTLDEVLVRLQLELLRTRRFEALKKTLLIRRARLGRLAHGLFGRWKRISEDVRERRRQAVTMVARVGGRMQTRAARVAFGDWRQATCEARALAFQTRALVCWNRMLAAERLCQVVSVVQTKRRAASFHRWRRTASSAAVGAVESSPSPDGAPSPSRGGGAGEKAAGDASTQSLQLEIKKLHEQLASSKSEAWRYKRQLLKQFL